MTHRLRSGKFCWKESQKAWCLPTSILSTAALTRLRGHGLFLPIPHIAVSSLMVVVGGSRSPLVRRTLLGNIYCGVGGRV